MICSETVLRVVEDVVLSRRTGHVFGKLYFMYLVSSLAAAAISYNFKVHVLGVAVICSEKQDSDNTQ